jgi:hypothetical protein
LDVEAQAFNAERTIQILDHQRNDIFSPFSRIYLANEDGTYFPEKTPQRDGKEAKFGLEPFQ